MISNCMNDFSNYTNGYERKNMIGDDDFATYFDFVIDFGIGIVSLVRLIDFAIEIGFYFLTICFSEECFENVS